MKLSSFSDINLLIILLVIGIIFLTIVRRILKYQASYVFIGVIGLLLGLILGDLLASPLSRLPNPWGKWLPLVVTVVITAAMVDFFLAQISGWNKFIGMFLPALPKREEKNKELPEIIVDTSSLIDGRIEELAKTGFVLGKLLIPRFVLDELQKVSDSEEPLKRSRGRRGLEVLSWLSKNPLLSIEIIEADFRERHVDKKLVRLAKERNAKLLTCDYNLNRIAEIDGISSLNINELAGALRPIVLPGENLKVKIVASGKEKNQGVGYLPDGTMIVVENGEELVGKEIDCQVERIFQTVAGKMIFVKPKQNVK